MEEQGVEELKDSYLVGKSFGRYKTGITRNVDNRDIDLDRNTANFVDEAKDKGSREEQIRKMIELSDDEMDHHIKHADKIKRLRHKARSSTISKEERSNLEEKAISNIGYVKRGEDSWRSRNPCGGRKEVKEKFYHSSRERSRSSERDLF